MSPDPATTVGGASTGSARTAEPASLVGHSLADRYRIIAKLGEGAMGVVYLGEHLRIGRRDAIKVLRPDLAQDREAIARFTRGTRNVSAISHPNVCTIYDFSDTPDGLRYLAMEYLEGTTLKEVLDREGRLPPARAVDIACQVADALQAAHDVGVIHRDLKPGNIMLCRGPRADSKEIVKVVDFDISKGAGDAAGEEVTRVGFVVGTPEYMSPEQLIGERLDGRSDLYSLAVVLFRMLTGRLPFRATNVQDMMLERLTGTAVRLDEVLAGESLPGIAGLQRALDRALARNAADRQTTTAEFGREIAAALRDSPVSTPASTAAAPTMTTLSTNGDLPLTPTRVAVVPLPAQRPRSRNRAALLAGMGAIALVVLGFGVRGWLGRGMASQSLAARDTTVARPDTKNPRETTASRDTTPERAGTLVAGTAGHVSHAADSRSTRKSDTETGARRSGAGVDRSQPGPTVLAAAAVGPMLERQLDALLGGTPGATVLIAARDSAELALRIATSRRDSATALLVLAQAALADSDMTACAKWARLGSQLVNGSAGFEPLRRACR
jgi:serine/threonine-protein kinase